MVRECLTLVEGVTDGQMRAAEVRSIASDHPPIQPHFWSKLGLAAAVVLALLTL
jgi:hypothetical protein